VEAELGAPDTVRIGGAALALKQRGSLHRVLRDIRPDRAGRTEAVTRSPEIDGRERTPPHQQERLQRAYDHGRAAALRGEEAAPGCTMTPEGKAFLAGYIAGVKARRERT
jgi:hypothetical protein